LASPAVSTTKISASDVRPSSERVHARAKRNVPVSSPISNSCDAGLLHSHSRLWFPEEPKSQAFGLPSSLLIRSLNGSLDNRIKGVVDNHLGRAKRWIIYEGTSVSDMKKPVNLCEHGMRGVGNCRPCKLTYMKEWHRRRRIRWSKARHALRKGRLGSGQSSYGS
jgi:hypothetical protein